MSEISESEGRLNLLEQVVDRLFNVIAMTGTPEQLGELQRIDDQWRRELTLLERKPD